MRGADIDRDFIEDYRALLHRFAKVRDLLYLGWAGTASELQMRMENRLRICSSTPRTPKSDPSRSIGREWLDSLSWMVEQGRQARLGIPPVQMVDVSCRQLTGDPYGQLPGIFERLGLGWSFREEGNFEGAFGDYTKLVNAIR